MKKTLFAALVLVLLLVAVALPAYAGSSVPAGDPFNLLAVDPWFPPERTADEPFHVLHGWFHVPGEDKALGLFDFVLTIDGVVQSGQLVVDRVESSDGEMVLTRAYLFNYPQGLPAGDHEFVAEWYAPCSAFGPFVSCDAPNEVMLAYSVSFTSPFVP